ncbi:MAG: hypothetical protein HYT83_03545 [Candidatus Levybacteria bacterium]|nr:hypothetical protein [Candidatus Levybacteria bacterium]
MQTSFTILFFCLFIFLFCLYTLSRDDFILIRKNVSQERVFNIMFIALLVSLFFARLVFVFFNYDSKFLNPLVFLLFPYFPGLSLVGALLGGAFFIAYYASSKKLPIGRLLDLFTITFLCCLPFGLFFIWLSSLASKKPVTSFILIAVVIYVMLGGLSIRIFQKARLKDISITFLFFSIFSIVSIFLNILGRIGKGNLFNGEDVLLLVVFLISLALFIRQEKFPDSFPKLRNN